MGSARMLDARGPTGRRVDPDDPGPRLDRPGAFGTRPGPGPPPGPSARSGPARSGRGMVGSRVLDEHRIRLEPLSVLGLWHAAQHAGRVRIPPARSRRADVGRGSKPMDVDSDGAQALSLLLALAGIGAGPAGPARSTPTCSREVSRVDNSTSVLDPAISVGAPFTLQVSIPSDTRNDLAGDAGTANVLPARSPDAAWADRRRPGDPVRHHRGRHGERDHDRSMGTRSSATAHSARTAPQRRLSPAGLQPALERESPPGNSLPAALGLADFPVNPSINLSVFYKDNRTIPAPRGVIQSVQVFDGSAPPPSPTRSPSPGTILVFGGAAL